MNTSKTSNTTNAPEAHYKGLSKFLSYLLRHHPEQVGLTLDNQGWVDTAELIEKINHHSEEHHPKITFEILDTVVKTSPKQRFGFNADKTMIRANQGHSIAVDLGYIHEPPPQFLYHGTATRFVESILQSGIQKQSRHHVHLSVDIATAMAVGQRYGKPIILKVLAQQMAQEGFEFYQSDNGVWLTDNVPVKFMVMNE